jgi:hypothetical protein
MVAVFPLVVIRVKVTAPRMSFFIVTFSTDVKDQIRKMDECSKLVKDNAGQFDVLWDMVSNIMETGKVIYKGKNKDKVKDYTYSELIKKVRLEQKKKKDNGDRAKT